MITPLERTEYSRGATTMSSMLRKKAQQLVRGVQGGTDRWVSWLKGTAFKAIALLLLGTLQLWLSLFLYGSFYYAYIPTVAHISPVYLQFSSCTEFGQLNTCPFPSVNTSLIKNPDIGNLLMRGQKYKVLLELDMPQSPVNEKLGVFMVKLDLYSSGGDIVGSSARPAMMHYQSYLLKTIRTLFFIPLLLSGYSEEKQSFSVSLMEHFVDNPYKPLLGASIQLQARQLEIYSSVLKIQAHFSGLRYMMYNWPFSTALFFVSIFFLFLSLITVVSWQQCVSIFSSAPPEDTGVPLPTQEVYTAAYEERRKMIRKSMAVERAALFKGRPKNVTVLHNSEERDSQSSGISSVGEAFSGGRGSSIADVIRVSPEELSSEKAQEGMEEEEDAAGTAAREEATEAESPAEEEEKVAGESEAEPAVVSAVEGDSTSDGVSQGVAEEEEEVLERVEGEEEEEEGGEEEEEEGEEKKGSEAEVVYLESAVDGPSSGDGGELRQRKRDPDSEM